MKIKDILSVTLKIIGLIAFWEAIQTFGVAITGVGIFLPLFTNSDHMNSSFMIAIGLSMILNFILPLTVAILFLFRTERVLTIMKIKERDTVDITLNKLVLYHMFFIGVGFMIIVHGAGNFIEFKYDTDAKIEYTTNNVSTDNQSPDTTGQEESVVTNSKNMSINFFALIEILFGIIILTKATEIAIKTEKTLDSKTDRLKE